MSAESIPQVTLKEFEIAYGGRHLIHAGVDWWAARRPDDAAIVNATRGTTLTWRELERGSVAIAAELRRMGFRHGDCLAASLPLLNEHILLELACFRLGVIFAISDGPKGQALLPVPIRYVARNRKRSYAELSNEG